MGIIRYGLSIGFRSGAKDLTVEPAEEVGDFLLSEKFSLFDSFFDRLTPTFVRIDQLVEGIRGDYGGFGRFLEVLSFPKQQALLPDGCDRLLD